MAAPDLLVRGLPGTFLPPDLLASGLLGYTVPRLPACALVLRLGPLYRARDRDRAWVWVRVRVRVRRVPRLPASLPQAVGLAAARTGAAARGRGALRRARVSPDPVIPDPVTSYSVTPYLVTPYLVTPYLVTAYLVAAKLLPRTGERPAATLTPRLLRVVLLRMVPHEGARHLHLVRVRLRVRGG